MGDPLPELEIDAVSIDGLEDVFSQDSPIEISPISPAVQARTQDGADQVQDSSSSVHESPQTLVHPISVEEAAKFLRISTNAVCKRLRKGSLVGKKTQGKFKEEWLVEGAGLIEILNIDMPSSVQDCPPENEADESTVQDQPGVYKELSHTSPSSVLESPQATVQLIELVEKQAAKLEAAAGQIGYLQAQLASQKEALETKEEQLKLLTDSQHKTGWWARLSSWFKV